MEWIAWGGAVVGRLCGCGPPWYTVWIIRCTLVYRGIAQLHMSMKYTNYYSGAGVGWLGGCGQAPLGGAGGVLSAGLTECWQSSLPAARSGGGGGSHPVPQPIPPTQIQIQMQIQVYKYESAVGSLNCSLPYRKQFMIFLSTLICLKLSEVWVGKMKVNYHR